MKIFQCNHCDHPLHFENYSCENCGYACGYRDLDRRMLSFEPLLMDGQSFEFRYCKNHEHNVCNWLIEKRDENEFCRACQLNRTIPNLDDESNFNKWKELELAKHRLIYQLQKMGLELPSKEIHEHGLCFDFVAKQDDPKLMTGHANGVITILIKEADSVQRELARKQLQESYRTLIGHLRHEVGHYFWDRLVWTDKEVLAECRALFGNEQVDYGKALKAYYKKGAPADWGSSFISQYATSHPWEDWAETWAHYLHIMDMVETSHFFGLQVNPTDILQGMKSGVTFDPYTEENFQTIIDASIPLSYAVNSINRAMGLSDVYPFKITPPVVHKMKFIHKLVVHKHQPV